MNAREIMHSPVMAATPQASARDIATKLVEHKISGMPVTEQDGTLVGVVTEEDMMTALMEQKNLETLTVQEIMSKDLVAVPAGTAVEQVMQILHDEGIGRVPVTVSGRVVGIISRADVIRALLDIELIPAREAAPVSRQPRASKTLRKKQPKQPKKSRVAGRR
jgi:CBS domain-containing protein